MKNASWTDGFGDQKPYVNLVRISCMFHETLPESNANKIHKASRGMLFQAQFFGRAKIRGDASDDGVYCSEDCFQAILDVIYKIYSL